MDTLSIDHGPFLGAFILIVEVDRDELGAVHLFGVSGVGG